MPKATKSKAKPKPSKLQLALRRWMRAEKITAAEAARRASLDKTTVHRLLSGARRGLTYERRKALVRASGIDEALLLDERTVAARGSVTTHPA